jgi:hydrogenase-4 membrane subunit HyfE
MSANFIHNSLLVFGIVLFIIWSILVRIRVLKIVLAKGTDKEEEVRQQKSKLIQVAAVLGLILGLVLIGLAFGFYRPTLAVNNNQFIGNLAFCLFALGSFVFLLNDFLKKRKE